ncbi:hypothetical protein [Halohasta salina]|uniref:hypothetical protein n=1 Tax=Halohasta salina TaxID=2961621 RepID=UPI0020A42F7F|nr:hypothetical protein [Halohasta salina]
MSEGDADGFGEGVAASQGDPRVLLAMNAVLSTLFGWLIVGGLSVVDVVAFDLLNVATAAIVVFSLTYYVTMS